ARLPRRGPLAVVGAGLQENFRRPPRRLPDGLRGASALSPGPQLRAASPPALPGYAGYVGAAPRRRPGWGTNLRSRAATGGRPYARGGSGPVESAYVEKSHPAGRARLPLPRAEGKDRGRAHQTDRDAARSLARLQPRRRLSLPGDPGRSAARL